MKPTTLTAKAPAKVNLSLDIVGKRPDGYHSLRTVMVSVSLYDDLKITLTPCKKETFTARAEGVDGCNIAADAARLFMNAAGVSGWSVHICIEKNIPICAGLGGGSSDAAAVLRALDGWLETQTGGRLAPLRETALKLGSDVPYCLRGGVCLCEGRGEILTPRPPLPDCWIVLCTPPIAVSTADAFRKYDELNPFQQALTKMSDNVFEAVTFFPEVDEAKHILEGAGAEKAAMSGSGPTVFGIFTNETQAIIAHDKLHENFPKTYLTKPVYANLSSSTM